jgi:predicted Zn-dependent peptidase
MKKRASVFASLLLIFTPAWAPVELFSGASAWAAEAPTELKLPKPEVEKLPNGMRIIWFNNDRIPVVDLDLALRSGSRDDPSGKSGTAELVAATLDRGAGELSAREIAQKVESLGATRSISADDESFHVSVHGLAPDSDTFLGLIAKMVRKPTFPAQEVKNEQARMLDGWNRLAEYGDSLVELAYRRSLTQGTPYARGAILSSHELAKIKRDDLVSWWRSHFTPANATLMVVGKVDRKAFHDRIVQLFGDWSGAAPHQEKKNFRSLNFKPQPGEVILLDRPSLNQAQVRIGFRAPLIQDSRHYPLAVANALLGEYFHSRLNTLIRDQLGLTYGIGSSYNYNRDLAVFSISAATRNEATAQVIEKTVEVLKNLKSTPVPSDEVATAKEYLIGGFPLSTATLESVAGRWMLYDLYDLGPDRLNQFVPKIASVQPSDVTSAVASSFDLKHLIIAVAGDAKAIEPVLKKQGFKVHKVSTQSLLDGRY